MDMDAIKEVNIMLEYMKDSDTLTVTTTKDENLEVRKSKGAFYVDKQKIIKPPQMNGLGSLVYYPPSLRGNLYIQTTEVQTLTLNNKVIYNLK